MKTTSSIVLLLAVGLSPFSLLLQQASAQRVEVGASGNATDSTDYSGEIILVKVNQTGGATSTVTLTGNNTYTGGTQVEFGNLELGGGSSQDGSFIMLGATRLDVTDPNFQFLGRPTFNFTAGDTTLASGSNNTGFTLPQGGTITSPSPTVSWVRGPIAIGGELTFSNSGAPLANIEVWSSLSGTGSVRKTNTSDVIVYGSSSYTGGTLVDQGTLTFSYNGVNRFGVPGPGPLVSNGTGTLHLQASINDMPILSEPITGTGNLQTSGNATVTLTGASTFTGRTTVQSGTLQIGNGGAGGTLGTGTVQLGYTAPFPPFNPNPSGGVLKFNRSGSLTVGGAIVGSGSGVTAVSQVGSGAVTLTGTSTYTGATSVTAGQLLVNGRLGNTPVTVSGGVLGGSGSIGGTVGVQSNATLSPGTSIESLATGTTSFASGATFAYEVDSSAALGLAADLLVVNGDLSIASGSLLTFADLAGSAQPFPTNTIFALINYTGAWDGGLLTFNGTPLTDGSRFSVGSQQWDIDYDSSTGGVNYTGDYQSGSFVTVTAVPEPSSMALAAFGIAAAGVAAWRRKGRTSPIGAGHRRAGLRPTPTCRASGRVR